MSENIVAMLNELANTQAYRDLLALQKQELIDKVLTPEIKAQLAEIDAEFDEKFKANDENIAADEAYIKNSVIQYGASVKGAFLHAVLNKPRISWDNKGLDGFAVAHPEINAFRKVGEPSVSIRKV